MASKYVRWPSAFCGTGPPRRGVAARRRARAPRERMTRRREHCVPPHSPHFDPLAGIGCLGGKHPIEQDGVGNHPADAAESRPQGCYNKSCLLWKELPVDPAKLWPARWSGSSRSTGSPETRRQKVLATHTSRRLPERRALPLTQGSRHRSTASRSAPAVRFGKARQVAERWWRPAAPCRHASGR